MQKDVFENRPLCIPTQDQRNPSESLAGPAAGLSKQWNTQIKLSFMGKTYQLLFYFTWSTTTMQYEGKIWERAQLLSYPSKLPL